MPLKDPIKRKQYMKEYHRRRYLTEPAFKADVYARAKKRGRAKINETRRRWRQRPEVKAKEKEEYKAFLIKRPLYNAQHSSIWRARARATQIEKVSYPLVLSKANGICGICDEPLGDGKVHIDHRIPLCKGGSHTYDNLQAAHARCNIVKNGNLPVEVGRR